ncbi:hypothetical protein [Actinomadura atramentaria]|uniref:hypothetical protein n=1 Tax=Actinomadura atramentaria TaxID=1990 RepID=UPI001F0A337B|nr:hypothetical protein [Actinomadura atramentaria]
MGRRITMAVGATAALGAALALTACDANDGTNANANNVRLSASDVVLAASKKTQGTDTFKAALTLKDGDGGQVSGTARFRLRPKLQFTGQLDGIGFGGAGATASGQAIFTGDTLYAKLPQAAKFVSGGKPWLKVDLAQVQQRTGFDVRGLVDRLQQVDPAKLTAMFTGSEDVRRVGTETVDGVKTTRYAGTVTVDEALRRLDAQARDAAKPYLPQEAANSKLTFDLWVDGAGLPREVVVKGVGRSGGDGSLKVLYSDFGKKFSVNPPPADETGALTLDGLFGGTPGN